MHDLTAKFRRDQHGAVAVMFGLILIVLGAFSGIVVDVSRAYATSSFVSSTMDQIALAVARGLSKGEITESEMLAYAQVRYDSALSGRSKTGVNHGALEINVDPDAGVVTASATAEVQTHFAGLVGHDAFTVNEQSSVTFKALTLDISLMLDITGSMDTDNRIGSLKTAATKMIKRLVPETPNNYNRNRVALAPFSAGINVNPVASLVTNPDSPSIDNCVVGRSGPGAHTDDAPGPLRWIDVVDPATVTAADDIDPDGNPDNYECPESEIVPLSKNRAELIQHIDNLSTGGTTAGHLGVEWAWYLVSPEWGTIWPSESRPSPYNDDRYRKAVVLMTDGDFLLSYSEAASKERARQACKNMKDKGVLVYAVVFGGGADAENLFQGCATNSDFYFNASNETELVRSFEQIGGQLSELRLVQ